ncbi:E3 ubiquitin-protein ligase UPL3 [Artemisia annua]|uniref:E3 ubiquitin-protein ligase UPL3 n=1 Tax=Artemisia annua TaxID=35608 RepID=A0A2U1PP32_ARTAN|nr:E3 ubiquitin-protein ligase UPL3 [Artemisia annua]
MPNFNINNLEEYVSLVVCATVKTGITRQMEAFRAGFNQVIFTWSVQHTSEKQVKEDMTLPNVQTEIKKSVQNASAKQDQ